MAEIGWVFSIRIKEGEGDAVKALLAEMVAHTKENEPGTLVYQVTMSEDGTRAQFDERYRDSEAGLMHMKSFAKNFAGRLMQLADPTGMLVFGEPDEALKGALDAARATYMKPVDGFTR